MAKGSSSTLPKQNSTENDRYVSTIVTISSSNLVATTGKEKALAATANVPIDAATAMYLGKSLESLKSTITLDDSTDSDANDKERWYTITLQVFIPFMIAGVGTIGAGIVLGHVEDFDVFKNIKALYILVPALIGLKGNLDMCLASRLSTQANLGNMTARRELMKMIIGNVGLVQVQAIVAASLVSVFAVGLSAIMNGDFHWSHALVLTVSSVLTATMSCLILDFVLIAVIIVAQKMKLNPDNMATPFAASIGDVVSLLVLSVWARFFYKIKDEYSLAIMGLLAFYLVILLPIWIVVVQRNEYTRKVLTRGWVPVLSALFISGLGGLVLDNAVDRFNGFVLFQPIINGIGGNLVSVQASRISTMLHKTSLHGVIPPHTKQWVWPWQALFAGAITSKSARILLLISIPGQIVFVFSADLLYNGGVLNVQAPFILAYLTVSLVQLMVLLYTCHIMIHSMWLFKIDPDNSAIPYLTALGDLLGSTFLLVAFVFLHRFHLDYTPLVRIQEIVQT